ncbi:hypothetical protein DPMN_142838 [Dreissena polymorpha]|uniref:Uncharacterized protein n=1 Tax=Dreissena polymorpha TaxID=45954 RepID=A0A9D4JNT7_DREPO|nr:hypothetical protein DPMN_142838 [Dreissena polymorpha]
MTQIEHPDMLSQTLPLLTHLQQLRICLKQYMEIKLPRSLKYVFLIYTTFSPAALQHFMQDMYTSKHNVYCKLWFNVEGNEDEYTRIRHEVCELDSVEVQQFDFVDNRHYCGDVAAAATLSSTADEADDDSINIFYGERDILIHERGCTIVKFDFIFLYQRIFISSKTPLLFFCPAVLERFYEIL